MFYNKEKEKKAEIMKSLLVNKFKYFLYSKIKVLWKRNGSKS